MSRLIRRYRPAGRHRPANVPPKVRYALGRSYTMTEPVDPWACGYVFSWQEAL